MRAHDHGRQDGHIDAWRELNARVAADLDAGTGDIKRIRGALSSTAAGAKIVIGWCARVTQGDFGKCKRKRA